VHCMEQAVTSQGADTYCRFVLRSGSVTATTVRFSQQQYIVWFLKGLCCVFLVVIIWGVSDCKSQSDNYIMKNGKTFAAWALIS